MLTLDNILNRRLNESAKKFHWFYSTIQVLSKDDTPWGTDSRDTDRLWNETSMFKRSSSMALAAHESVKQVIFDRLAAELSLGTADEKIDSLIGENGSLMRCEGSVWRLCGTDEDFIPQLTADDFAYRIAALEHRRWCCFVASSGWKYGAKRNDSLKIHDCLTGFDALLADPHGRSTVKYDLMSLMARYRSSRS